MVEGERSGVSLSRLYTTGGTTYATRMASRLWLLLLLLVSCRPAVTPTAARPLRILIYPYIPSCPEGHAATEQRLERELAAEGIAAEVDVVDPDGLLYGARTAELITARGYDVLEVDTMLLDGVMAHIQPLEVDLATAHPAARVPVTRDAKTWGVPHWLCGFFLYSHHPSVAEATTVASLEAALHALEGPDLVGDASSSWDLPALYVDAWHDQHPERFGGDALVGRRLEPDAVASLRTFLSGCDVGERNPCLDGGYENHAPAAAEAFVAGRANALFGYSERLASLPDPVRISALPLGPTTGRMPLFSDAFVVAKRCTGDCLFRARAAIDRLIAAETYDWLLARDECSEPMRPRYLLPAQAAAWELPSVARDPRYQRLWSLIADGVAFPTHGYRQWREQVNPELQRTLR